MNEQTNTLQEAEAVNGSVAATEMGDQQAAASESEKNVFRKFMEGLFKGSGDMDPADPEPQKDASMPAEEKHFSQADVDAAVESARQKWQEETAEKERLEKLSPEERAAEEQAGKDREITELKNRLLRTELRESAVKTLERDGFPVGLAELLDYSGREKMEESLANATGIFKDSLAAAIQDRLKGRTPSGLGNAASSENMIADQIAKNVRGI